MKITVGIEEHLVKQVEVEIPDDTEKCDVGTQRRPACFICESKGETKMSEEFEVIEEMQLATMDVRIIKVDGKYYCQQWDKLEEAYMPYLEDLLKYDNGFDTYEEVIDDVNGADDNQVIWDLGSRFVTVYKREANMSKEFEVIEEIGLNTMDVRIIKVDGKYYWQQWDELEAAYIPYLDDLIGMGDGFDTYEDVIDDAQGTDDNQVIWDLGSH